MEYTPKKELIQSLKIKAAFNEDLYKAKVFKPVSTWQELLETGLKYDNFKLDALELKRLEFNPMIPSRDNYETDITQHDGEIVTGEWHGVDEYIQLTPDANTSILPNGREMQETLTIGNLGNDALLGNDHDNILIGGTEEHMMGGGQHWESTPDDDVVYGFGGNDQLYGGRGDDYLDGGTGIDTLFGGDNDDILDGGRDRDFDYMEGGQGQDLLIGRSGGDTLVGGSDEDTFFIKEAAFPGQESQIRDFQDVGDRIIFDHDLRTESYNIRAWDLGGLKVADVTNERNQLLCSFNYTDGMVLLMDQSGLQVAEGEHQDRGIEVLNPIGGLNDFYDLV